MYAHWRTAAVLKTFIATKVPLVDQMTMVKCMVTLNKRRSLISLTNWVVMSCLSGYAFQSLDCSRTGTQKVAILKVDIWISFWRLPRKSDYVDILFEEVISQSWKSSESVYIKLKGLESCVSGGFGCYFLFSAAMFFCTHPWLGTPDLVLADFPQSDVNSFQYIAQGYKSLP